MRPVWAGVYWHRILFGTITYKGKLPLGPRDNSCDQCFPTNLRQQQAQPFSPSESDFHNSDLYRLMILVSENHNTSAVSQNKFVCICKDFFFLIYIVAQKRRNLANICYSFVLSTFVGFAQVCQTSPAAASYAQRQDLSTQPWNSLCRPSWPEN